MQKRDASGVYDMDQMPTRMQLPTLLSQIDAVLVPNDLALHTRKLN